MDIKKIRQALFLTQVEFAKKLEVDVSSVSFWEVGKYKPTLKHQRKIIEICQENKLDIKDFIKK